MVYVILVYDIDESRVAKVLNTCRKYLIWVQRSVFEGDITEGNLNLLSDELKRIIKMNDVITIYMTPTGKNIKRIEIGSNSRKEDNFL